MSALANALGGFGSLFQQQQSAYDYRMQLIQAQMQGTTASFSSGSTHTTVWYEASRQPRTSGTPNLEWLDSRVNEMRVRL